MFNNDQQQQGHCTSIPRISFSSDFTDAQHQIKHESSYREPPVSLEDFKFSIDSYGMISADELISKGKLLPLNTKMTTLREELLVDDDDDNENDHQDVFSRLQKGSGWWKERLGLKRAHIVPKKADLYANKTGTNWWTIGHEGGEAM
ncbi:hypothetical protein ACSBR1_019830 [Camellia fascicularis]